MKRIFFNSLKGRLREYVTVLVCGIFTIAVLFWSNAAGDCLYQLMPSEYAENLESVVVFLSFIVTYELLFFLLVLVLLSYIRKRSYDYALLTIMGMKKKHRRLFIGGEYAGIVAGSLTGGILLGMVLAAVSKYVLSIYISDSAESISYGGSVFRTTILAGVQIFFILFIVFDEIIACLGTDAILSVGRKGGRPVKKRPKLFFAGVILLLLGWGSLWFYWGRLTKKIPMILAAAGIFFLTVSTAGYFLCSLMKKEQTYYKKIFWIDNWYHRFFYNVNMNMIVGSFIFVALFGLSVPLFDNFPLYAGQNYPYDLVWMANETDQEFLDGIRDEYGVEMKRIPCIQVTTGDQGEQIGISADTYQALTGKAIILKDDEIYVVYQREHADMDGVGMDYGTRSPRIYTGPARPDLWVYVKQIPMPKEMFERYRLNGWENRIITGVINNHLSNHFVVFSDERYQELKQNASGSDLAVLMNIPQNQTEVMERVKVYAAEHSQISCFTGESYLYEKGTLLNENYRERILGVMTSGINILILMICAVVVTLLKIECDWPDMQWKYQFYRFHGMPKEKMRVCIFKETAMSGILPAAVGVILASVFNLTVVLLKRMPKGEVRAYLLGMLLEAVIVLVLFGIFVYLCSRISGKHMWKEERS